MTRRDKQSGRLMTAQEHLRSYVTNFDAKLGELVALDTPRPSGFVAVLHFEDEDAYESAVSWLIDAIDPNEYETAECEHNGPGDPPFACGCTAPLRDEQGVALLRALLQAPTVSGSNGT